MSETKEKIGYRSPVEVLDARLLLILGVVAAVAALAMVAQGAAHDGFHNARHALGVACH